MGESTFRQSKYSIGSRPEGVGLPSGRISFRITSMGNRFRARITLFSLLCLFASVGCGMGDRPRAKAERPLSEPLVVFAAASLSDVLREYAALPSTPPFKVNAAGSQTLASQILSGANADIFVSANRLQAERVLRERKGPMKPLFTTKMVVAVARGRAGEFHFGDLGGSSCKVVLAAPEVPAGAYARVVLERAGIFEKVRKNVVSWEPDVRAALAKVEFGEVDAGIVYRSDLRGRKVRGVSIPDSFNVTATYYAVVLPGSAGKHDTVRRFLEGWRSPGGRALLERYGFEPVGGGGRADSHRSSDSEAFLLRPRGALFSRERNVV
ncbi:MAG: molybdate ABC transporter substrate-binding protein [Candidatus Hydrogenedentota bacterium]|nr:MAG: molybdate ABC transporter substrate-binding protein [Candidatus Hydrogenedentota bacterium]